jgi:Tfp pilus assembly protein PilN
MGDAGMKRINLISEELRALSKQGILRKYLWGSAVSRIAVIFIFVMGSSFLLLFSFQYKLKFQVVQEKKHLKMIEEKLERGKDEQGKLKAQIQAVETENAYVTKRAAFLEKAKVDSVKWAGIISMFSKLIPSSMWLNKIALNKELVTLDGVALDNKIVSDFMVKLDESGYFTATSFNFTRKRKDTKDNTKETPITDFEITTQLAR